MTKVSCDLLGANLFLVGAAKAGTTSLAEYLDQHVDIAISQPKEPNFFALEPGKPPTCRGPLPPEQLSELLLGHSVTDPNDYGQLFVDAQEVAIRGDASVRYLYAEETPQRIYDYQPDSKIVAILRDPVSRMHSHYHMNVRMGVEPESFEHALRLEAQRRDEQWGWDWHYTNVGCYGEQLSRYIDAFGRDQVKVVFFEDFRRDAQAVVREVFRFAEVDHNVSTDTKQRANVGQTPRFRVVRNILWEDNPVKSVAKVLLPKPVRRAFSEWVESKNRQPVPKLDPQTRVSMLRSFDDDRQLLESILGRRMPW